MARQFSVPYQIPPVGLLPNAADSAGRTSAKWVNLRNGMKAWIVCRVNQGASNTVLLTPLQATTVAGAGSKALTAVVPIWLVADTSASDALVVQTAAANFTTSAGTTDKIVVFELTPEMCMDIAGGFHCIGVSTGASSASNITSAEILILQAYQGASAPTTYA